jgi:hypothetical protein
MDPSANLEARVWALELEYARLTERLRTVGAALGGAESSLIARAAPRETRVPLPRPTRQQGAKAQPPAATKSTSPKTATPGPSAKKTVRGVQAGGTRKWFEKGEALELFRKILKQPMRTRDLMARVVAAKRKSQLPKEDLERFKWAVHSAIKEAVGANAIVRQGEGMIAVASGNARAAAKGPSKAKK